MVLWVSQVADSLAKAFTNCTDRIWLVETVSLSAVRSKCVFNEFKTCFPRIKMMFRDLSKFIGQAVRGALNI